MGCANIPSNPTMVTAATTKCYLLQVNIWPESALTSEMQVAIKSQKFPQLSSRFGSQLRQIADGPHQNPPCLDFKVGKANPNSWLNTGKVKRSLEKHTVIVTQGILASKIILEESTVQGVARFYFDITNRLTIHLVDEEGKIIYPQTGFFTFDASEWGQDDVMNVHFVLKNKKDN